ncbi:MAG: GNAT family N-acetyltransferase [Hyphomicrobium sp.]|nr:GNAT family N-acetyltransferase [Hyphomicrobium sp.]
MAAIVRALAPGDEARWRDLFQQYVVFYEATVPPEIIDLTWQRLIAGADGMSGLVAEVPGAGVVGIAVCVFHRSSWSPTWYCYLEDLFVDPACRGQGVGRALIQGVYELADARGATRTYWATSETNATARALYERLATLSPFIQYRR